MLNQLISSFISSQKKRNVVAAVVVEEAGKTVRIELKGAKKCEWTSPSCFAVEGEGRLERWKAAKLGRDRVHLLSLQLSTPSRKWTRPVFSLFFWRTSSPLFKKKIIFGWLRSNALPNGFSLNRALYKSWYSCFTFMIGKVFFLLSYFLKCSVSFVVKQCF